MSSFYSPGCNDDKGHVCDMCGQEDGRPTIYFKNKDFDICHECIEKLYSDYSCKMLHDNPVVLVKRKAIKEKDRDEIFKRDNYKCVKCGDETSLTVDHILPFCIGGKTELDNFQTLCKKCNSEKGCRV